MALKITANGETKTIKEWAETLGCKPSTIHSRIRRGMSDEEAVTTPLGIINRDRGWKTTARILHSTANPEKPRPFIPVERRSVGGFRAKPRLYATRQDAQSR